MARSCPSQHDAEPRGETLRIDRAIEVDYVQDGIL